MKTFNYCRLFIFRSVTILVIALLYSNLLYCQNTISNLIPKVQDAVFTVYAKLGSGISQGSGFFISSSGIGVTNYHVLDKANHAYIVTRTGRQYNISHIIDFDEDMDLVKFKVEATPNTIFKTLKLQMILPPKGSSILSLSTPVGFEQTLSTGIVSALRNDNYHGSLIQITAPISHGSSGSPILNLKGEVVGIATFGYEDGQSLNFAVATNELQKLRRTLNISVKEMGKDPLETENIEKARLYLQRGNYKQAIDYLNNEIRVNANNHIAFYLLSKTIYSSSIFMSDRWQALEDALTLSHQASLLEPNNSKYHCQKAFVLTALGMETNWSGESGKQVFDMAIETFQKGLSIDSLNINAVYGISKILCEASRPSSLLKMTTTDRRTNFLYAINLLSIVESVIPSEDCYNYIINAYVNLEEYGKALLYCDRVVAFNPNWYRGYLLRGDIKIFNMNMLNEGLLDLERALALCDSPLYKADIYSLRGLAYEQKAFKSREKMVYFVNKALNDYQKAYELTQNPKYIRYKDELTNKFNNSKVSKDNL